MKKIWYVIVVFCLGAWFLSSSPDPVGTYVAKHHTNTIDTILVLKGGTYKQSIYRKSDGVRLFHNEGKWSYQKGRIRFTNFFQSDDVARKPNYDYASVLLVFSVPLERNFVGRPVFDYDKETATYRYYKVLW
ncbi:hypothetical protein [Rubrolithibacter danxiaensis]|uniref:hypothetical protein n=1 Tax=Rubrolithibacter danxiaensis TaxID=3390805 RepID=UPI003BF88055